MPTATTPTIPGTDLTTFEPTEEGLKQFWTTISTLADEQGQSPNDYIEGTLGIPIAEVNGFAENCLNTPEWDTFNLKAGIIIGYAFANRQEQNS